MRPACVTPVAEGMKVQTDTPEVRRNITGVLTLLRANHPEDCMTCTASGNCEFQDLIRTYKVPRLPKLLQRSPDYIEHHEAWQAQDNSSLAIHLDKDKCIKCGRCVTACEGIQDMNVIGLFGRGRDRHVGFLDETTMEEAKCIACGQCVSVCPVGALTEREEWRDVLDLLQHKKKVMLVQTAPAVRVAIGEEMGLAPGAVQTGQMVAALRRAGFNYVFDTDFSADLTIMEEGTELLQRLAHAWSGGVPHTAQPGCHSHAPGPLPMFTSCCPAWVNLVEKSYPELAPHLSTAKSPQQMFGAVAKTYWAEKAGVDPRDVVLVSIMPCTAKKHEADRGEMSSGGVKHVDYVLTTREAGQLLRHLNIPMASLPPDEYDAPLGRSSGAGALFGNTGGVMEAALRTVYEVVVGRELPHLKLDAVRGLAGVKEAMVKLAPKEGGAARDVHVAVASGIANAKILIDRIKRGEAHYDFVEVMSCPGGCIGGGGQPKYTDPDTLQKRMDALYSVDERAAIRKSHENPDIQRLYQEYFGQPCGSKSHELLHTHYTDRSMLTVPAYSEFQKAAAARMHVPESPCAYEPKVQAVSKPA